MAGNVLLDFARTFDDRKLLVLFAIVVNFEVYTVNYYFL
jgi:hypothetical protein